jgi:hypothetical protein
VEDYPRTLLELERRFAKEDACRSYLFSLRWPEGFICPRCGGRNAWAMDRGLWLCQGCRAQVSVTSGTIFQGSRLPLTLWFRAIWYITTQKNGVSALGPAAGLGFGQLQDGLGAAAQVKAGDGTTWQGTFERTSRGG